MNLGTKVIMILYVYLNLLVNNLIAAKKEIVRIRDIHFF